MSGELNTGFIDRFKQGAALLAVTATLGAGALVGCGRDSGSSEQGGESTTTALAEGATTTEAQQAAEMQLTEQELRELLSVSDDMVTVDCPELVEETGIGQAVEVSEGNYIVKTEIGALKGLAENGVENGRLWSDAISIPLPEAENNEDAIQNIQARMCEDPLVGVQFANSVARLEVNGVKVSDLDIDWLQRYEGHASDINDVAAEFVSTDEDLISEETREAAIARNQEYQAQAELFGTTLARFQSLGLGERQTATNLHLAGNGVIVSDTDLPEVEQNPDQYNARAYWFGLTEKDGNECDDQLIGFNDRDMRIVTNEIVCETPLPPTSEEPTPPSVPDTTQPPVSEQPTTTGTTETTAPPTTVAPTTTRPAPTTTAAPTTTTTRPAPTTTTTAKGEDPGCDPEENPLCE